MNAAEHFPLTKGNIDYTELESGALIICVNDEDRRLFRQIAEIDQERTFRFIDGAEGPYISEEDSPWTQSEIIDAVLECAKDLGLQLDLEDVF